MLSLVNYDPSDESDNEEQQQEPSSATSSSTSNDDKCNAENGNTNENLAETSSKSASSKGNVKNAVKISIPSLSEFDDDDEPSKKQRRLGAGTSGLVSLLPQPKNAFFKQLFPVRKLAKSNDYPRQLTKPSTDKTHIGLSTGEPDTEPASSGNDFFNLIGNNSSSHVSTDVIGTSGFQPGANTSFPAPVGSWNPSGHVESANLEQGYGLDLHEQHSSTDELSDLLNDEGFLRLQGKKHRGREEIKVIDVSADQQMSDCQEWLTKTFSEEKVHRPSRRKGDMPTQQQRRKHQITYLAFQAKERELELKNQWAQNRLTKRETQAKYGF